MRNRRALVCALLVALSLAACSNNDATEIPEVAAAPSPTPTPEPRCPLTGAEIPSRADLNRPAVAVKIENSPAARPQSGIENADLVYEEIVEGGITRFMAIFHCGDSDRAGPVRSARFDDPKLAIPFTRIIAFSGSNAIVQSELGARGMVALDENSGPAFFRDPPGVFEVHNLFVDTVKLPALAPKRKARPPSVEVFTFGELPESADQAKLVRVNFTASNTIEYKWKGGKWKRWEAGLPFLTVEGGQVALPNVLVQEVRVDNSNHIVDSAGNPSPDIELVGSGRALLFRDGSVIKGRWAIAKEGAPPVFTMKDGEPLLFAEGPIWIELVPSRHGEVKGSFSFK